MIKYHGGPITPCDVAVNVYKAGHAFVSFYDPRDIEIAAELCESFAVDNGAFSAWRKGITINWPDYYEWVNEWKNHPGFDFAVIPDVIDGDEAQNDELLKEWPHGNKGAPVWHLHESLDRFKRLCNDYDRVCLGSSGEFAQVATREWWQRMFYALKAVCVKGQPPARLHGLRMLNPKVFSKLPLTSADSTNVAQNHKSKRFKKAGYFIIKNSIEAVNSCGRWDTKIEVEQGLF